MGKLEFDDLQFLGFLFKKLDPEETATLLHIFFVLMAKDDET